MKYHYLMSILLGLVSIVLLAVSGTAPLVMVLWLLILLGLLFSLVRQNNEHKSKIHFYQQIVDSIPHPISVTDLDMKWTFVNKAATEPLGVAREDVLGQHCSNWGANICKTDKCGVECLRKGNPSTSFNQWGKDFNVISSYIVGLNGERVGHIEIVQEVSEKVALQHIYHDVESISRNLTYGASNLNEASQDLTVGSSQQAASVTEIVTTIVEISNQAEGNAQQAAQASEVSMAAKSSAGVAAEAMQGLEHAMSEIQDSSVAISDIIGVIEDIASQTNLLALNASIEAARAGATGKGFSVVADEVRKLAERSTLAASESAEYIQRSAQNVAKANETSVQCAQALTQILQQIESVSTWLKSIDDASRLQAHSLNQINTGMSEIDEVVHSTATSAEETSVAAKELTQLASKLNAQLDSIRKIDGLFTADNQKQIEVKNIT